MGSLNGRVRDFDVATLRAEKTASRRYEAAIWLKKIVSNEFPETHSLEEFKSALKNGIILCNAINKVHPGSVSQVVEDPVGSTVPDEVAALRAYQHFENLRNFLVAMKELGLPTFESSDLEQEGTGTGVVNCILALKTYSETKKLQGPGPQRSGAPTQSSSSWKFVRKNPTLFRSTSFKNSVFEKKIDSSVDVKMVGKKDRKTSITSKEDLDGNKYSSFDWQERQVQELKNALHDIKYGVECMKKQHFEEISRVGKNLQDVVKAASGYHKVLEENRKLYNQVMDLKGNIRVYCRVRPFLPGQRNESSSISHINEGKITILTPKHGKDALKSFNFNKVFAPSATQEEVFADMQPLIRSVLDGYNVCIFAYGQTGSGKTHTMAGPKEITKKSMGVNYRALNDLFYLVEKRREDFSYEISVQMIEIYNEQVRDLLSKNGLNQRLEIKNNALNGLNVPEASLVSVKSTQEVIELMKLGQRNRSVGSTAINDRSSRSHSCLTVHIKSISSSSTILRGSMHLIDLAGSERVEKSEAEGERLREAQHINKSLSALGDVVFALASKGSHVPYRNSKLTQLLQGSLGGQAKTLMFVHISPETDAIGETISTLNFAERVSSVELGSAHVNKESSEVKELSQQIVNLKEELARKNKENELLKSMTSSTKVYRNSPPSNHYTEVSENTPTRKKQISPSSEDKQSTESDSSTLIIRSSTNLNNNNNINNHKAHDQELDTDLDALVMHTSDNFTQKCTTKLTPNKVNRDESSFKKPHQRTRNNSQASSISIESYNNHKDQELRTDLDANQMRTIGYSSGKESIKSVKSQSSFVKMTITKVINGDISSVNKPQEKINKSTDIRPGIISRSPSQLRKIANGSIQTINSNGRQLTPNSKGINIKRKPSGGKTWK